MELVIRNNKGFTLVEVMIAFVIILIVMLGLLSLTAQVTTVGVQNTIRDEGIKVAEEVMDQIRALPYDKIDENEIHNSAELSSRILSSRNRNFRNFKISYTPSVTVGPFENARTIDVTVTWQYRGTNYQHTISSLVRKTE